jgi:hypothetical protein
MPINTPETDQAIAAQEEAKGGDFSPMNVPSPAGFQVPQVAPIPIPGTGLTVGGTGNLKQGNNAVEGTNIDQDLFNKIFGTKTQPYKVGNLPTFTADQVYNKRYPSILPGEDSEEAFAKAQSWTSKWGHALVKFGATAVGTFYNGMIAIPSTIKGFSTNDNAYTSENSNGIDTWMKNLEDEFPNYYTKWEQAHPFLSALPFSGGSANFWGDKMLKNLGFTVGAIASAAATDLIVGAATEGLGEIPMIGNQVGRAALWLNKIFTGENKVKELINIGEGAGASAEAITNAVNLQRVAASTKIANGTRYAMNMYGAAASEAGFEARDGYNTVRNDLMTAYQREKGYSPYGQDLVDIETTARASANVRFGINLVLLGVSNAVQFDNLLKPFSVARTGAKSTIETELGEAGKVGLQEGSRDVFETVKGSRFSNLLDKSKPYIADILSEGVYEEGGQYAAQIGTQNYYDRKYLASHKLDKSGYSQDTSEFDSRNAIGEILHSTIQGLSAEFGTTEGLENVFLGALTGVVTKGAKAFYDRFKGNENSTNVRNATLAMLNSQGVTGTLQNNYDNTVQAHRIAADMKAAVDNNDIFKYKNLQHEQFSKFITSGLRAGRFDVRLEQIDLLKDMSNDEFKKAFGMDKTDVDTKTVNQYVDLMKEKAQSIKKTYDLIDDTFSNPFVKTNGSKVTPEQMESNINHDTFNNWKDDLTYFASIQKDVNDRQVSINQQVKGIDPRIDIQSLKTFTDGKSLKQYAKTLQQQADLLNKSAELKESPTKVEDKAKAKQLEKIIGRINTAVSQEKLSNKQYEGLFNDLLNHNVNPDNDPSIPLIPPQATTKLIQYGRDYNRLDRYKQDARDTFEKLSSNEGIADYFQNRQDAQDRYKEPSYVPGEPGSDLNNAFNQPVSTEATATKTTPTEVKPQTIVLTSKDGKTSRTFEQGKSYFLNTGKLDENKNPIREKVEILRQPDKDTVVVQNEAGEEIYLPIEQLLKEDPIETKINEAQDEVVKTEGKDNTPKPNNEENDKTPEGDTEEQRRSMKDLAFATRTSTDPNFTDKTTDYNNFQRRHQIFLYKLGSNDPKVFNQENRNKLRVIYVNKQLSTKLGFPDEWIDKENANNEDTGPIRVVYVIDDRVNPKDGKKGIFYSDDKGNKLAEIVENANIGARIDPSNIIYTNMTATNLKYEGGKRDGELRYTNKQDLDETAIQNEWRNKRKEILAINDIANIPIMQFNVSRGLPNIVVNGERNAVTKVGIIIQEDMDRGVITIPTQEGKITINSAGDVNPVLDGINFKTGRTLLNSGLNVSWLNSRKFTDREANNIFDIIKYIPTGFDKSSAFKYLRGLIFMPSGEQKSTDSSIKIDGMSLYLGKSTDPIFMKREELDENKDKIIDFLKKTYHNADNPKLNAIAKGDNNIPFIEYKIGENGELEETKRWKNYNYYLLSDVDSDGKLRDSDNIPFTTNIKIPETEDEIPFIQKYIQINDEDYNASQFKVNKTVTVKPAAQTQETKTKAAPSPKTGLTIEQAAIAVGLKDTKNIIKTPYSSFNILSGDIKTVDNKITGLTIIGNLNADGTVTIFDKDLNDALTAQFLGTTQNDPSTQPTIDNTNEPKQAKDDFDDLLNNPDIVKTPDPQYRTAFSHGEYEKIDIEKEYSEFKDIVGDRFTLQKLDHLLKTTGGGFAWGAVQGAMVYVYKNAEVGTLYHEAFESIWGSYLTGREQQDLYKEFKSRPGNFISYLGQEKSYSTASLQEAKEQMAEDFRDLRMGNKELKDFIKDSPKKVTFFQKLIDFIKRIVFGNPNKLNKLFDRMNKGYYRNYSTSARNIETPQYSRVNDLRGLPEAMVQDTLQGMTVELFQEMFREGSEVVELLDEKPRLAAKIIYSTLKQRLTDYYEGNSGIKGEVKAEIEKLQTKFKDNPNQLRTDMDSLRDQYNSIIRQWNIINAKWDSFVEEHKKYLRIFSVEFKVDDEGNIDQDTNENNEEDDNKNQNEYARDNLLIDAKNSASTTVKLLLASIADSIWKQATSASIAATQSDEILIRRDASSVGLPKAAQYAKLFNYILHSSANKNGIYSILDNLNQITSDVETRKPIDANIKRVLGRLNADNGFKNKNWAQVRTLLKFEGAVGKNKPAFYRLFLDNSTNLYFKESVLNSKLKQLKQGWVAGIKASDVIIPGSTDPLSNVMLVNERAINNKNIVDFLNYIGIPITPSEYRKLKGINFTNFNKAANAIRGELIKAAKSKNPIEVISSKGLDFDSRLTSLAQIYVNIISGDDTQSQHPNLDNEQTSSFVTGNFITTIINDANNSANKEEFINQVANNYLNDIFHQDSYILNNVLFNQDGTIKQRVEVGIVEGLETWDGNNKTTAKATEALRSVVEINNNLNGVFYTLLPADAKTEYAINSGTFLNKDSYFGNTQQKTAEVNRFINQMKEWLQTEINLAIDYKTNPNRRDISELNKKYPNDDKRTKGESLRFFGDLLPKDIVDKIHKEIIDSKTNINDINSKLQDIISDERFRSEILDIINQKANNNLAYLKSWKVFLEQGTDNLAVAGIDKKFLNDVFGSNQGDIYKESDIKSLIAFREMNYMINNIDMHKLFFGDPAQYSDELKRIKSFLSGREQSHVDTLVNTLNSDKGLNTWAQSDMNKAGYERDKNTQVSLKPGDPGYKVFTNHMNTFTLEDIFTSSSNNREDYDENNEADSQAYMMDTAYREMMMKGAGRWTTAQEEQYQRDTAKTRLDLEKDGLYKYTDNNLKKKDEELAKDEDDNSVAYQPLKFIYSGVQTINNVAVADIDKASWQYLNYQWFKGRNLGKLYVELQKKGIDYVRMKSAQKVGNQISTTTALYNDKGEFNTEGIQKVQSKQVSIKHFGIQVEQQKKEKGQTEGSQLRKDITMDLMSNGTPIDFIETYTDPQSAEEAWDKLDEKHKLAKSKLYRKVVRFDKAVSASVNVRTDNKMKELGVVKTEEGYLIKDKKKISDYILRELERRELPENIKYALDTIVDPNDPETRDFAQPLEANVQYQKIRQVIYSIINRTIQRPKFFGGMKTMVSVTGFEKGNRIVKKMVNGKPVLTSDTLKTYTKQENGKSTTACEVMLPYYFQKRLLQAGSKRTKEEVIHYLNTTADGKKLLRGIGFRIPTQGLNSIDFFTIKDFLPENMGDVIVLPSEITTKAGSDFDIDKLNVYLKNFYIDKKTGFPKLSQFENINTNDEQALRDYYEEHLLESHKHYQQYLKSRETLESASKLIDSATESEDDEYALQDTPPDYVPTIDEFILENKGKDPYSLNDQEAIENEYQDAIEDLLSESRNYDALTRPNSAAFLKSLRNRFLGLKESPSSSNLSQANTYGKLLDSLFMMKERHAYLSSKSVVGIAATANTFHAMTQKTPGGFIYTGREGFVLRFAHNTYNGQPSLSGLTVTNHPDLYISNIISQIIDGGVDVAKDKFLAEMGINKDTVAMVISLIRAGATPRWAVMFINQPIIQEFLKRKAISDSIPTITLRVNKQNRNQLIESVKNDPRFNQPDRTTLSAPIPETYSVSEMEDMIKADNLNPQQRARQYQMLGDYFNYNQMGWDLFASYSGYNWDTGNTSDPNIITLKEIAYQKANTLPMTPVSNLMKGTFLETMKNATLRMDQGFKSIIRVQRGAAYDILRNLAWDLSNSFMSNKNRQKIMLKTELSMVDYAIQNSSANTARPLVDYMNSVLMGDTPVAKYVKALKESTDKRLSNNPFVKNLLPVVEKAAGLPSTVRLIDRDYDTYTSNVWTDGMRELKDDNTVIRIDNNPDHNRTVSQIFNNLVVSFILQFGGRRSSNSATHLIPNEDYAKFTKPALEVMNLSNFDEVGAFYRNNITDNLIVPYIRKQFDYVTKEWTYFSGYAKNLINVIKQDKGQDFKAPILLNIGDYITRGRKYVKWYNEKTQKTELFQRVEIDGLNEKEGFSITPRTGNYDNTVYKQINIWGNGINVQEYHQNAQPSILTGINPAVNELSDEYLIEAYQRAKVFNNATVTVPSQVTEISNTKQRTEEEILSTSPTVDENGNGVDKNEIFSKINPEEVKRSTKKDIFNISSSQGEVGETEGYPVKIPSHPDMDLYVRKEEGNNWVLSDNKTGHKISDGNTAKEAISKGIDIINKSIEKGQDINILNNLGVQKKYDEPDKDLGECKS